MKETNNCSADSQEESRQVKRFTAQSSLQQLNNFKQFAKSIRVQDINTCLTSESILRRDVIRKLYSHQPLWPTNRLLIIQSAINRYYRLPLKSSSPVVIMMVGNRQIQVVKQSKSITAEATKQQRTAKDYQELADKLEAMRRPALLEMGMRHFERQFKFMEKTAEMLFSEASINRNLAFGTRMVEHGFKKLADGVGLIVESITRR